MSLIGILAVGFNPIRLEAQGDAIGEQSPGTVTLQDISAGRARLVDLTHTLTPENAFWPGEKYRPFQLVTIAALKDDGVLSKAFAMPEHLGMHIDAPNHFERDHVSVDRIPPSRLVSPGVLVDILAKCEQNADYELTVEDVAAWETQHGRIPDGAIVLLRTGWARYWNNVTRYQGRDVRGLLHFPAFSKESAAFLVERRHVRGVGIDTLSIDRGISQDFAVHHIVNGAGRYGLENVANLDKLPPNGFHLIIAPIKIGTGSGGPTCIFAVLKDHKASE